MSSFRNLVLLLALLHISITHGQVVSGSFGKGVRFMAPDSSMSMIFSTRFQTLVIAERSLEEDRSINSSVAIRRFRLKFDGFAVSPKLHYKIELALSNSDNGRVIPQSNMAANIVLDAIVQYEFARNTQVWFGQFKLPGNRERVISSQKLQFVDRSLVNSRYNLDRDLGLMLRHEFAVGDLVVKEMFAVAAGQGRNVTIADDTGLSYTGRIELLPFGEFTNGGDYFGSDLAREERPKLSVAAGYSLNQEATRKQGELGAFLPEERDLSTAFADLMFKYRGLSVMSEYMNKMTGDPILADSTDHFVTGDGLVVQAGYLFRNDLEVALRYTTVHPAEKTFDLGMADEEYEYTLGVSKYFVGHNLKIQTDISYSTVNTFQLRDQDPGLVYRFQMELAL